MESTIKKLPNSQIELRIEVSAEELNHFIDQATLNLGKDLEIKGFRKGKAPKGIVEKKIGREKILIEAADLAVRENYQKAILENKIEAIFQPKIEIQKLSRGDSFVFLAKTAVLPEIELPDYKKIASKIKRKEINPPAGGEEKEIAQALKWLQRSRAKFTLKNQPAQKGDFIEIEYWPSQIDPRRQNISIGADGQEGRKDAFILGEGHFLSGFEEKLIGMRIGEEKDGISVDIPENHSLKKIAGERITLKVKVKSVQNIGFPEINDQFVKGLGKFENLESLKKNIKEGLSLEKRQVESRRLRQEILEKISKEVKCDIPNVLVEREQKQMMENLKKQVSEGLKISFTEYLNKTKKTEKEILNSLSEEAQKRVKNFLVLREIGKGENIEVLEEEIREEVNKVLEQHPSAQNAEKSIDPVKSREAGPSPSQKSGVFNRVDLEGLEEYTKEAIRTEKTFAVLESLVRN